MGGAIREGGLRRGSLVDFKVELRKTYFIQKTTGNLSLWLRQAPQQAVCPLWAMRSKNAQGLWHPRSGGDQLQCVYTETQNRIGKEIPLPFLHLISKEESFPICLQGKEATRRAL